MILYFSGTGNSAYAAKRIAKGVADEALDLFEKIRANDFSELHSERPLIFAAPTYAWRLPRIVQNWIERTPFSGSRDVYFVLTCGGSIGNANRYLARLCRKKGWNYLGCMGLTMPENYIALYPTPTREEAAEIIDRAEPEIDLAIRRIKAGEPFPEAKPSITGALNSGVVNPLFYPLIVHSRKFRVTDSCVSCGKCAGVCPLGSIRMVEGKPVWSGSCTHCMACICRCPQEAIEYGSRSAGQPRYVCPREP